MNCLEATWKTLRYNFNCTLTIFKCLSKILTKLTKFIFTFLVFIRPNYYPLITTFFNISQTNSINISLTNVLKRRKYKFIK